MMPSVPDPVEVTTWSGPWTRAQRRQVAVAFVVTGLLVLAFRLAFFRLGLPAAGVAVLFGAAVGVAWTLSAFAMLLIVVRGGQEGTYPRRRFWIRVAVLAFLLLVAWPGALAWIAPGEQPSATGQWLSVVLLRAQDSSFVLILAFFSARVLLLRQDALRARWRVTQLRRAAVRLRGHLAAQQLQPHFLFNSLGVIADALHEDVRSAVRLAAGLRRLVRRAARQDPQRPVALRDEVQAIEAYVELLRARFGDRLDVVVDVAPELLDAHVPPLVLQPIVENALAHGLSGWRTPGLIVIRARATARGGVRLEVADNGRGLPPDGVQAGRGLGGIRALLDLHYGDDAMLTLGPRPGGGTLVTMDLPGQVSAATLPADDPATANARAPRRRRMHPVAIAAATWTSYALVGLLQWRVIGVALGRPLGSPGAIVQLVSADALLWFVWTLSVLRVVPRTAGWFERSPTRGLLVHTFVGHVVGVIHVAALAGGGVLDDATAGWTAATIARVLWSALLYGILVTIAYLHHWRHEAEEAIRTAESEARALLEQELVAARGRIPTATMLFGLRGIERAAALGVEQGDLAVESFADLMRALLEQPVGVPLDARREARACADLLRLAGLADPARTATQPSAAREADAAGAASGLLGPLTALLRVVERDPSLRISLAARGVPARVAGRLTTTVQGADVARPTALRRARRVARRGGWRTVWVRDGLHLSLAATAASPEVTCSAP